MKFRAFKISCFRDRLFIALSITEMAEEEHYEKILIIMDQDTKLSLFRKFGSSHIGVALPAIVGAKMCMDGEASSGVISSECLEPDIFFKKMAAMGIPVSFDEKIVKRSLFQ